MTAPSGRIDAGAAGRTTHSLPPWIGVRGEASPQQVQDAFEALLIGEILKPLEASLRDSGLFPAGASGEVYAQFWKQHLGQLLAEQIDLLPPAASSAERATGAGPAVGAPPPLIPLAAAAPGSRPSAAASPPADAMTRSGAPPVAGQGSESRRERAASTASPARAARAAAPRREEPAAAEAGGGAGATPSREAQEWARRLTSFEDAIQEAARLVRLGANWLRAVIVQESGGDPRAVSRKGAQGLMQLLPATGAALGVENPFDPFENVGAGARYLAGLVRRFGDVQLALAAYNAGPGRVESFGGVPPFHETRRYVSRVLELKEEFDRIWPAEGSLFSR
jgi:soluble lytic murein transglycosylase-like protein